MKQWLLVILLGFFSFIAKADPLPASEVFKVNVQKVDPNTISIHWDVLPNYFLYSDRIKLSAAPESNVQLGNLRFPPTLTKTDKLGKTYTIYRNQLVLPVGILGIDPGETLLNLRFQGCSDDGFCYPPEIKQIKVAINNKLSISQVSIETPSAEPESFQNKTESESIADVFINHGWLMILLIFYGFGLLLSFTPCILPMVPVLSGIIVGHGKNATTKRAFFLSLSYVLSMSVTYAIIGAVVALLGANLQISMQSPWAIGAFSLLFVLLAISMFGFYEFKLPDSWQTKIAGSSREQRGGHYLGAAIMGCLSTLILSPCVTAPLIGVLTYIAQTGNVLMGSITLFILSLGMGTPLLVIGTSAGKWLPESGSWMNAVKAFFGILLLAVAIYLLERIIPIGLSMGLWACLLIFSGIYAGALTATNSNSEKFMQGIGIVLFSYGLLILVGAAMGATNPLQPLARLQMENRAISEPTPNKSQTVQSVDESIKLAYGRPVMLDFYADWCASCKIIENTTFKDPRVVRILNLLKVIKVDVTENSKANQKLMQHFKVVAPPTFVFYNAQGQELKELKLVGDLSAEEFLKTVSQIGLD
ncbi:protein-disulfide reductase DsbD [Legionella waltersii]|uniref:Thiol:disulfide interchange protein DsbD n=1 Tax=Legionella waltersii TaxID=66969 RepID=A0A0W1A071_9GAMM|nr:protein-disulfide reductase DsbD [Legionella waltersii]KTD74759.1 thiol:disulfide interchange protein DsbD [Legionella waltersii]SNV00276.1 thiol:disulfide interchange protein DsbD [Legionella waltersii]